MKNLKLRLASTLLLVLLCSSFCTPAVGFSATPTHTDTFNDHTQKDMPANDIWQVWISHDATSLRFKVTLNGTWDDSTYHTELFIWISVDDATGTTHGGDIDFLADYCIYLWSSSGPPYPQMDFFDFNDGSPWVGVYTTNDVGSVETTGLGNYSFSNGDRTVDRTVTLWYKLQDMYIGKGYLDVALGQTIKVKFTTDDDEHDTAPNVGLAPLTYRLQESGGIIFLLILFPVIGVALGLFLYYRRRDVI